MATLSPFPGVARAHACMISIAVFKRDSASLEDIYFFNKSHVLYYRQQPTPLYWHLGRPQLQANTAWNESLHNSLRKRVSLALPCWKLARTINYWPFCTASAICCMLSITISQTTLLPIKHAVVLFDTRFFDNTRVMAAYNVLPSWIGTSWGPFERG